MEDLEVLKRAVVNFLKSKKLEVFEDVAIPAISASNISEIAVELYSIYRLLKSGKAPLTSKMFSRGTKVDIVAWYRERKVPAFAISLSEGPDRGLAEKMNDLASYSKLVVHLQEAEPKRMGNVVVLSSRDLEEYIDGMLSFFRKK